MPSYEITAAGFDGGTDETDDRVFWIEAADEAVVAQAIEGTGAKLWPDELSDAGNRLVDYALPDDTAQLRQLLLFYQDQPAGEAVNRYRNHYDCPCGTSWTDDWSCMCDDRCPACDTSCSPTESEDLAFDEAERED